MSGGFPRRAFLAGTAGGAVAALAALSTAPATAAPLTSEPGDPAAPHRRSPEAAGEPPGAWRLLSDPGANFALLMALGAGYYGGAVPGKLLTQASKLHAAPPGDFVDSFAAAGDEARGWAETALAEGDREGARQAFLWASNAYYTATYMVDEAGQADRFQPLWTQSRQCWDLATPLFRPAVEKVAIPYEGTHLQGYLFRADDSGRRRPLLILNNGSDGSVQDMWTWGAAAGTARGYDCLTFDGPGQGHALWIQRLYFRPDWEKVITPVVDFALTLPEVDPDSIALQGISQGGYWVPRAAAFEHRIAAAIADPGVTDVSASWLGHLPPELVHLLDAGQREAFDEAMRSAPPRVLGMMQFRMRPFGMSSPFDVYRAVREYNLDGVVERIRCPMLITEPEGEQFWPGQSQALYDRLQGRKSLVRFTFAEGAGMHCEPLAPGLRDLRVFSWLGRTLGHRQASRDVPARQANFTRSRS